MTTEFRPNEFVFGDKIGFAAWQVGHARQHLRYLGVLAARSPPVILADIPLFRVGETKLEIATWFETHYFNVHLPLRQYAPIGGGSNFSYVDLSNPSEFYDFINNHNAEHQLLDQVFGL